MPEILQFAGAFVVAVVLHTLWDSQSSLIGTAVVAIASLGLLAFTAHRAGRQADPFCDRSGHDASTPRSARGSRPAPDQGTGAV